MGATVPFGNFVPESDYPGGLECNAVDYMPILLFDLGASYSNFGNHDMLWKRGHAMEFLERAYKEMCLAPQQMRNTNTYVKYTFQAQEILEDMYFEDLIENLRKSDVHERVKFADKIEQGKVKFDELRSRREFPEVDRYLRKTDFLDNLTHHEAANDPGNK